MLTRLTISNYALIDHLEVDFHPKLNTITGETGAGKSIILGALALILGNRADLSVLKNKAEKCVVEGNFEIEHYQLAPFFETCDLDYDPHTILRREITPAGKSRAFVNDTPVNLKTLRELGLALIDIHSQHQNLELGNQKFQLDLIDTVGGSKKTLVDYKKLYSDYRSKQKALAELKTKAEKSKSDLDYFQFQFEQLEAAKITDGEQADLESELEQLSHAEEIKSAFLKVKELLDDEQLSAVQNVKESKRAIENIAQYMESAAALGERLQSCWLEMKDMVDEAEMQAEKVEHDPVRIQWLNDRLNVIYDLQQKHNVATESELIALRDSFESKISEVVGFDNEIDGAEKQLESMFENLVGKASELSSLRKAGFPKIEKSIVADLRQMGMEKSKFKIEHTALAEFTPQGKDSVLFLFSANSDAAPAEISKIASGGEMSRLMLAIKNLLRNSKALPTVIFDEIDSGVSGEIAVKMGKIIKLFSGTTQIVNITHLPQIAAKGDAHLQVYKYEKGGKTFTSIRRLNDAERVEELAKMVGGEKPSSATLKTAQELLEG